MVAPVTSIFFSDTGGVTSLFSVEDEDSFEGVVPNDNPSLGARGRGVVLDVVPDDGPSLGTEGGTTPVGRSIFTGAVPKVNPRFGAIVVPTESVFEGTLPKVNPPLPEDGRTFILPMKILSDLSVDDIEPPEGMIFFEQNGYVT